MENLRKHISERKYIGRFEELYLAFDMNRGLHQFEAYALYCYIREYKPKSIIEMSPDYGFSTYIMLNAIYDEGYENEIEYFKSYDLRNALSLKAKKLTERSKFYSIHCGNAKNILEVPLRFDFWFIDSDHSKSFATWYIKHVSKAKHIFVHDIDPSEEYQIKYRKDNENTQSGGEPLVVIEWLKSLGYYYKDELVTYSPLVTGTDEECDYKSLWTHNDPTKVPKMFWSLLERWVHSHPFFVNQQNRSLFFEMV